MKPVLLDTNIVSFILKNDSRLETYKPHLQNQRLAVSFMTVAELFQWAMIYQWGTQRNQQLEKMLVTQYTILSFNIDLCRIWGDIRAKRRAIGKPMSGEDAWIAATALQYDLTLITHNPKDFTDIMDLQVISEVF